MSKKKLKLWIGMTATVFTFTAVVPVPAPAQAIQRTTASPVKSRGAAAIDSAAKNGKYLFILFWKEDDAPTRAMNGVVQATLKKAPQPSDVVAIQISDLNEKTVVDKYGVSRAPMPLVLVLAPNGAITQGIPQKCTEKDLMEAYVSPGTAKCLKALQDRKLVLLCVQNQKTQFSQAALQGARDFKSDVRYAAATEIVTLDPTDKKESEFLTSIRVSPATQTAVTVLLAPPGSAVAHFSGAVSKDQIAEKLAAATSSCCPGGKCGPGGCK